LNRDRNKQKTHVIFWGYTMFQAIKNFPNFLKQHFWISWLSILVVISLIHCLTLTTSPPIWIDEVSIIEIGRTFFEPHSDWSIHWNVLTDSPSVVFYYFWAMFQELAFRAANFSIQGPRLLTLLGAMTAATTLVGWLLSRQISRMVAYLLGVIFLLDPMFTQSYRGDRIDCWVFASCLASCWLLRIANQRIQRNQSTILLVSLAGSLAAIALFIWPSALILYPLIAFELISLILAARKFPENQKTIISLIFGFVLGGIVTTLLLLIPIWNQLSDTIDSFRVLSQSRVGQFGWNIIIDIVRSFIISPFLPIIAVLAYRRNKILALTSLFAFAIVASSGVYIFRSLYLLPYFVVLTSEIYRDNLPKIRIFNSRVRAIILILLLSWSISLSLIVRPIAGLSNQEGRNPDLLVDAGISSIGEGEFGVWDSTWQFYATGRLLKWKMFQPFGLETASSNQIKNFLDRLDYAIFGDQIPDDKKELVKLAGFKQVKRIDLKVTKNQGLFAKLTSFIKSRKYGPYTLYSRNSS
jgi:hypothetical protein